MPALIDQFGNFVNIRSAVPSRGDLERLLLTNFPTEGQRMQPPPDPMEFGEKQLFRSDNRSLARLFGVGEPEPRPFCSVSRSALLSRVTSVIVIDHHQLGVHDYAELLDPWSEVGSRQSPVFAG